MKRLCIQAVLALAAVLALTAGVGVATGAIPSTSDGTISACIANFNGTQYLRPIDKQAGQTCKTGEKPVNWNQKGPKGDPGPQGARGATGPAGPKGSGLGKIVSRSSGKSIPPGLHQVETHCAAGERVIGGGFELGLIGNEHVRVMLSDASLDENKWVVEVVNDEQFDTDVFVQALCAS